jgi:hypothetical protein
LLIDAFRAEGLEAPRLAVSSVMSPHVIVRLLENDRFIAVVADSVLNFFYARRAREETARKVTVAILQYRNRQIEGQNDTPCCALFTEQAERLGAQIGTSRK